MSAKSLLYSGLFFICIAASLFYPYAGIYGYIAEYCVGPNTAWWGLPLRQLGVRTSYALVIAVFIGMLVNRNKSNCRLTDIHSQEILLILFCLVVWIAYLINPVMITSWRYQTTDPPTIKITKIAIFALLMTHTITDRRKLSYLYVLFVTIALIAGYEAWQTPLRYFKSGRLENIGGPDFSDANRFGGFMAGMLFLIGAQFLRSGWKMKIFCFVAGGFAANAIVLTRSRGAFLGVAAGCLAAIVMAPKKHRLVIVLGLLLAATGIYYLMDAGSIQRVDTISADASQLDESARSRLEIWRGGIAMLMKNPLGVGPGNFYQKIGIYAPNHPDRDAHNTLIRCAGELGFAGITLLLMLLSNAVITVMKCLRISRAFPEDAKRDFQWMSFGSIAALAAMLGYGMTGTLTYTEFLWWMIMIPVCVYRSLMTEVNTLNRDGKHVDAELADQTAA